MGLDLYHVVPTAKTDKVGELDYFTVEELSTLPEYVERHKLLLVEVEDEEITTKVLYYKIKGYQRKGMNRKFYNDFKNDQLYFELLTVERAYQYLEADHMGSLEELQDNFRKNFMGNFIEGESIFFPGW